VLYVVDKQI